MNNVGWQSSTAALHARDRIIWLFGVAGQGSYLDSTRSAYEVEKLLSTHVAFAGEKLLRKLGKKSISIIAEKYFCSHRSLRKTVETKDPWSTLVHKDVTTLATFSNMLLLVKQKKFIKIWNMFYYNSQRSFPNIKHLRMFLKGAMKLEVNQKSMIFIQEALII